MSELDLYWQKGGTYIIPVEVINQLIGEFEDKDKEIERLNNIIKEKDKDFELLRKAQLKKCQEYENLEKLNKANYQSFIEVNNILNELEKYLNEQVDYMTHHSIERMVAFDCCRHKLQELKKEVISNEYLEISSN